MQENARAVRIHGIILAARYIEYKAVPLRILCETKLVESVAQIVVHNYGLPGSWEVAIVNMAAFGPTGLGCSVELQWLLSAYFSEELKVLLKHISVAYIYGNRNLFHRSPSIPSPL